MIRFNTNHIGDDFGVYDTITNEISIFLGNIWHEFKIDNGITENLLVAKILDTIVHEQIHSAIDDCLEDPEETDDHNIYRYLYV